MRILELTAVKEKRLLAARASHDAQALRVAERIVADVKRRGDSALFAWTRRLDGFGLAQRALWISQEHMSDAIRRVSPDFLRAIRQAARNIRSVAERQLPKAWSLKVETGVKVRQLVRPIDS